MATSSRKAASSRFSGLASCASAPRAPNARSTPVSELDLRRCRRRTTPQGGRIVRTKTIILGAIAALALATLSANAGNRATHHAQGSLLSLVAATTSLARADREAEATAAAATHVEATEAVSKPAARPVSKIPVSGACQDAIKNLKVLHQADVAEDTAERAAAGQPPAANATNAPLSKGPGNRALFYLDDDAIDLAVAAQDVHAAEALQIQPFEAATQLIVLPPDDGGRNGPRARGVPCQAEIECQVE